MTYDLTGFCTFVGAIVVGAICFVCAGIVAATIIGLMVEGWMRLFDREYRQLLRETKRLRAPTP